MTSSPTFDFGPYRLDPAKCLLVRDGGPVPLPPKAFDTLLFLVEHRERVVSKDELLHALWPDTIVEEASLTQQIFLLRKTLNATSQEAEYIATIPRRGYRFVAEVQEIVPLDRPVHTTAPIAPEPRRIRWPWIAAAAMLVIAAAGLSIAWHRT